MGNTHKSGGYDNWQFVQENTDGMTEAKSAGKSVEYMTAGVQRVLWGELCAEEGCRG